MRAALAALLLALAAAPAFAQKLSPSELHGYMTYLRLHPPKEKPARPGRYPFPGRIIRYGEDIPVCAEARKEENYKSTRGVRHLLHGLDGWLFRQIEFRTDFLAQPDTLEYFRRLGRALAKKGQVLVVAYQPARAMMSPQHIDLAAMPKGYTPEKAREGYRAFLKQLRDAGIVAPDLSAAAEGVVYYPKGDFHWTPAGARDSARKLAAAIGALPVYDALEKMDFDVRVTGLGPADRGAYEEYIQKTCKVNIQMTSDYLWSASARGGWAADLLGEARVPGVVLLGTSNSSKEENFNFAGALRQLLRADVFNAAVAGGGFGTSSFVYFASEEYHRNPPRVIVWEFLPQHDHNETESLQAFRQMLPAIEGACPAKGALAHYDGPVSGGETSPFKNMPQGSLKNTYLYLHFRDPEERKLKVQVLYESGDAEEVEMTRPAVEESDGKYFLELGHGDQRALALRVATEPARGSLDARLCAYPVDMAEK